MKLTSTLISACLIATFLGGACNAQDVYVASTNGQIGHGFLRAFRNKCYVILPRHIVAQPGEITVAMPGGLTARAAVFKKDPVLDLALLTLDDSAKESCRNNFAYSPEEVDKALGRNSDGLVYSTSLDGSSFRQKVFVENVTNQNISVVVKIGDDIAKQMSGSVLRVDNIQVGMLIDVKNGKAQVYPEKLIEYFWSNSAPHIDDCSNGCSFIASPKNLVKHFEPQTQDYSVVTTRYDDIYRVPDGWPLPPYFHIWRDKIDVGMGAQPQISISNFTFSYQLSNRAADISVFAIPFQTLRHSSDSLLIKNEMWLIDIAETEDPSELQISLKPGNRYTPPNF